MKSAFAGLFSGSLKPKAPNFYRFLSLVRPERKLLLAGGGLVAVSSVISMAVPYGIGRVIDTVSSRDKEPRLPTLLSILGGVFLVGFGANFGKSFIFRWMGEKVTNDLRRRMFSSLMSQNASYFDKHRTGDLVSRLFSDTSIVSKSLTGNLSEGMKSAIQTVAGASMMCSLSPSLCVSVLAVVPPLAMLSIAYGKYVKNLSLKSQDALALTTRFAEERLGNMRTVKSWAREDTEVSAYSERSQILLDLAKKEASASASFYALSGLAANAALLTLLYISGGMVSSGAISVGELSSFLMYAVYAGASISGLSSFYSELMKGLGASEKIFDLIESRCSSPPFPRSVDGGTACQASPISFQNVSFKYEQNGPAILSDVSLTIPPGKIVALVGSSGSGKSTLASLLMGLYAPTTGAIMLGNERISRQHLDMMSIVPQEPHLFSGSIADNISYGAGDGRASTENILEAASMANALPFIRDLPDGIHTEVGERGLAMSGGQKQRIALARACLKKAPILILDEATSALDAESEHLVHDSLKKIAKERTCILIAHRLSTIKLASHIWMLEKGKIIEEGSFEELMARGPDGLFFRQMEYQIHDFSQDVWPKEASAG